MKQITTFYLPNKMLVLLATVLLLAVSVTEGMAQRTITGTVQDSQNDLLPGVSVLIVGTTIGTVTDINGRYFINVPEGSQRLSFSFIGFETQIVEINSRSIVNLVMREDSQILSEVVVTAFGVQRERKELGYTVQALKPEDLTSANDFNLVNSLSGKIAGVQVTNSGSQIGASSRIVIRGNASFSGNQPLFVVDGIPIDNSSTNLGVLEVWISEIPQRI